MYINYKYFGGLALLVVASGAVFLLLSKTNVIDLAIKEDNSRSGEFTELSAQIIEVGVDPYEDIENQGPLQDPPSIIKAIYSTNWSMSTPGKVNYFLNLLDNTELNSIIIDIKDYTGIVPYKTEIDLVNEYNAWERRILQPNKLIKDLHDRGIYVIGRVSVFQDLQLVKERPDLALISSSTGAVWQDYKKLTWLDPAAQEVWDYNIAIAKDAMARGFDEINFDYIRFASDGNLKDIKYPFWDERTLKIQIMQEFFKYLRRGLPSAKLSADLFGLVTVNTDGLGIGQHLEYALPYFDAIAPMVYPSHYSEGFIGYANPAEHPYEVIKYSLDSAIQRIKKWGSEIQSGQSTTSPAYHEILAAKLRPWFQDFDLGADYDAQKIRAQIDAWSDAASNTPELNNGWMLWNARNIYTEEALMER